MNFIADMEERIRNILSLINLWRMGLMWVLALLRSYLELFSRRLVGLERAFPPHTPDAHHRPACIVTGASSGIGKATAEVLALKGYYVILAGRSMSRLLKVVEEFKLRHKKVLVKAMTIDLTSMHSILEFKEGVEEVLKASNGPASLQLLINNAGVLAATQRKTKEGCDYMIASNYLGHFMLTELLLPLMQQSSHPSRIVNVGSFTHRCVHSVHMPLQLLEKGETQMLLKSRETAAVYEMARVYEASKLFMVLFAYELHRRFSSGSSSYQITAMAADPGIVHTEIFREFPRWLASSIFFCLRMTGLMQSPAAGCKAVVDAALASPRVSGKYFFGGNGRTVPSSALSNDQGLAGDLWTISAVLCRDALAQHRLKRM